MSFAELQQAVEHAALMLRGEGVLAGQRAVVMTPDPFELCTVMCALLSVGAIPVLVDPGLPRAQLRVCLDEVAPEVFVGKPAALLAGRVPGWGRGHVRSAVAGGRCGRPVTPRGAAAGSRQEAATGNGPVVPVRAAEDLAVIAFTSGSTGVPKGVEYRFSTITGQLDALGPLLDAGDG